MLLNAFKLFRSKLVILKTTLHKSFVNVISGPKSMFGTIIWPPYTGYAGWAVTAGIPVNFGTAHRRSRPEVGSAKRTDMYGSGEVSRPSHNFGKSEQDFITPTDFLRPKHNFYSLIVCNLDQYLPNSSKKSCFLS